MLSAGVLQVVRMLQRARKPARSSHSVCWYHFATSADVMIVLLADSPVQQQAGDGGPLSNRLLLRQKSRAAEHVRLAVFERQSGAVTQV